jgi:hypothetical protein
MKSATITKPDPRDPKPPMAMQRPSTLKPRDAIGQMAVFGLTPGFRRAA